MRRTVLLAASAAAFACLASFAPGVDLGLDGDPNAAGAAVAEPVDPSPSPTPDGSPQPDPSPTAVDTPDGEGSAAGGPTPAAEPTPSRTASAIPSTTSPEGWLVAAGDGPVVGEGGRLFTFTVEVAPDTGVPLAEVLEVTEAALLDTTRGWTAAGTRRLQRVGDPARADVRVVLATPAEVDARCAVAGIRTNGAYSCWEGQRAMLTLRRWTEGAVPIPDLDTYRTYLVNHEVGHGLGLGHVGCPGPGELAPVMMQQTKSTDGCVANGWPHP